MSTTNTKTTDFDCDLLVIGAGSGGVRAGRLAAQRGARVIVVEGGALGGTCVNVGCIPKKLYSYAAHYAEAFEQSHGFGWEASAPRFDWGVLKARRAAEIARLNGIYDGLLKSAGRDAGARLGERGRCAHGGGAPGGWRRRFNAQALHRETHPAGHRRPAAEGRGPGRRLGAQLRRHVRPGSVPAPAGGGRRRLHRLRVRVDLQRPGRAGDAGAPRAAAAARLRPRGRRLRHRRDAQEGHHGAPAVHDRRRVGGPARCRRCA